MRKLFLLLGLLMALPAWSQSNAYLLSQWPHDLQSWPAVTLTNSMTYGQYGNAVGDSAVANSTLPPQIMGATPSGLAAISYATNDAVGRFTMNTCAPPVAGAVAGTFTTTSFVPTVAFSGATMANFRNGMWIITQEAGTFYRGQINGWDKSGGTFVTVSGWFQQGNSAAGQTPPNVDTVTINPFTKCWGENTVLTIPAGSIAGSGGVGAAAGSGVLHEYDANDVGAVGNVWGVDVNNLVSTTEFTAFQVRGKWQWGYLCSSQNLTSACMATAQTGGTWLNAPSMTSGNLIAAPDLTVTAVGVFELGSQTGASSPLIEAFDSGHATPDFITAYSWGNGTANGIACYGALSACGNEAFRVVSAGTGQVNQVKVTGTVTGSSPTIAASGADATLDLSLSGKGASGAVLAADGLRLPSATVGTLPTCNTAYKGVMYYVTDASSPTYNGTLTGGSSTIVPVFCNGTAWTAH